MAEGGDDKYGRHQRDTFCHERDDYDPSRAGQVWQRDHRKDRVLRRSWEQDRKKHERHDKGHRPREKGRRHPYKGHGRHDRDQSHYEKSRRFSPPVQDVGFQAVPKRMRRGQDDAGGEHCHEGVDFRAKHEVTGVANPPPHLWVPPKAPPTPFIPPRFGGSPDVAPGCLSTVLKSFKEFLLGLEPTVEAMEAVRCYSEYKVAFRRQQMEAFFMAHREDEWFRLRYHPEDIERWDTETHNALRKRLGVFMFLLGRGWFDHFSLDIDQAPAIIKLLDAVQIRFEGGTENDLRVLETPVEKETEKWERGKGSERPPSRESQPGPQKQHQGLAINPKHRRSPEKLARKKKYIDEKKVTESASAPAPVLRPSDQSAERKGALMKGYSKVKEEKTEKGKREEVGMSEQMEEKVDERGEEEEEEEEEESRDGAPLLPRQLHKTCSLFMRSIPPTVWKEEIVKLCARYPGFMRVGLSEPCAEHRFFRRCWVTFDLSANIQDICYQLQNVRLREYKLSPVVHRDLSRRVRAANGITQHRTLLQDHIRLAAKLICTLDSRWRLWGEDQGNPILKNISHDLIEEVSAEEEELTGHVGGVIPHSEVTVERDNKLVKVLDYLLLYLRIVHSVDFYSANQHSSENEMPSCCGTVHVRGPIPPNRVPVQQMLDWQKRFEDRLSPLFCARETLCKEEAEKIGQKQPEQEVEKFVMANTHELNKDKWLCVLCGKKFKGLEFVCKHLLSKHGEKVEEVRKEAVFFNNFLMDPKRPTLPEMKSPPPIPPGPGQAGTGPGPRFSWQCVWGFDQPSPPYIGYDGSPFPPEEYGGDRGHFGWHGRGLPGKGHHSRGNPRKVFRYHDWDAPVEDVF